MRGGESIRVLVRVLEPVLVDGVPSDQALTSFRISETMSLEFRRDARGTVIVSDLQAGSGDVGGVEGGGIRRDLRLWSAVGATGEGRERGEGGVEGWAEAWRVRRGGRVGY